MGPFWKQRENIQIRYVYLFVDDDDDGGDDDTQLSKWKDRQRPRNKIK